MEKYSPSPQDLGISPPLQESEAKYSRFVAAGLALKTENPEQHYSKKNFLRNYILLENNLSASPDRAALETTRKNMMDLGDAEYHGYSEPVKNTIRAMFEWRTTDKPGYRRTKERARCYLLGDEDALSEKTKKLFSKEEWRDVYEGILALEYKEPIKLLKDTWDQYKNPSTRESILELSGLEILQVHQLVRGCLEDLSFFSIPCTKPLGVSARNMGNTHPSEHDMYHVYNDESEDVRKDMKGVLQTRLLDGVPPVLRKNIGKSENKNIELIQFFDHPSDDTKIMMLVGTIFPAGDNKHDPGRGGSSEYLLALSRGNMLVEQLRSGKCTRLVDHVLRNVAS